MHFQPTENVILKTAAAGAACIIKVRKESKATDQLRRHIMSYIKARK